PRAGGHRDGLVAPVVEDRLVRPSVLQRPPAVAAERRAVAGVFEDPAAMGAVQGHGSHVRPSRAPTGPTGPVRRKGFGQDTRSLRAPLRSSRTTGPASPPNRPRTARGALE